MVLNSAYTNDEDELISHEASTTNGWHPPPTETQSPPHCHQVEQVSHESKSAERVLWLVAALSALFIAIELTGGILAGSLAIMTDAGHMISDLLSFFLSIVAIRTARQPASKRLSFGYERAEVLGALISIIILWVLTTILVLLAIERIVHDSLEVDADTMLITAGCGVAFNIIMGLVLHYGSTGHTHSHHGAAHGHSHADETSRNVNVRAALIHVVGDLIQSLGVLIAAIVIKYTKWNLADPICTFFFSIVVLFTTIRVLRDIFLVLMEATPRHLDFNSVRDDLVSIDGVVAVHDLHIWSLNMEKAALSVHLALDKSDNAITIVSEARELVRSKYNIHMATIQVESYDKSMSECERCLHAAA